MVDLQTDEEKAEAIKKWWKENGIAVISGVAIGLAAIYGWRAWTNYQEQIGQQASLAFEELLVTVSQAAVVPPPTPSDQADADEDADAADADSGVDANPLITLATEQQARLSDEYSSTPYAFFGQLAVAKAQVDQGEAEAAAEILRSAMQQAPTPLLKTLAGLRLARVLIATQEYDAAKDVIKRYDGDQSYAADFAALRGDIALAEQRIEDARTAYEQALAGNAAAAQLIRLKLQDLPAPADS
ncbi:YfgM family protein [Rhabdochromatium marinum]|uniref:YfgM family protein n=1 Tax=Rhabdochromatium marinum TaxID=48729 RepID=UPI0019089D0D|nr:tetratricopeptide repeat protein [Rhabdochromatium marinum]MBK1649657.1 hypothetical protein [Rhabdochromatium marinum]